MSECLSIWAIPTISNRLSFSEGAGRIVRVPRITFIHSYSLTFIKIPPTIFTLCPPQDCGLFLLYFQFYLAESNPVEFVDIRILGFVDSDAYVGEIQLHVHEL